MNINTLIRRASLILLAAAAFAVITGCATAPAPSPMVAKGGQLIVTRSFNLAGFPVALLIDGHRAATLTFNRDYSAPIAPGPHTLNVQQIPYRGRTQGQPLHIVVQNGQTYRFTAIRVGPTVVLQ
jgi:hypothetical protein